ncbi:MAG: AAA family ATPase [bacterium]
MYESFFGLEKKPFEITPDPAFMYASQQHKEALASLIYGVKEKKGLMVLTGEVGTGKTLLVRCLLQMLDPGTKTGYIINPRLSLMEFFQSVAHEFGLGGDFSTKAAFLERMNHFLLETAARGDRAVLIVDEAQNLGLPILEEIRLLMNLETSKQKLLQVILAGQPELHKIIEFSCMRQFKQRISLRAHLNPLSKKETALYIRRRLEVAGLSQGEIFDARSVALIHKYSSGIPRLINVVCDNSMLTAYALGKKRVSPAVVREVIGDLEGKGLKRADDLVWPRDERDLLQEWAMPRNSKRSSPGRWVWVAGAVVVALAGALAALGGGSQWFPRVWAGLKRFLDLAG